MTDEELDEARAVVEWPDGYVIITNIEELVRVDE